TLFPYTTLFRSRRCCAAAYKSWQTARWFLGPSAFLKGASLAMKSRCIPAVPEHSFSNCAREWKPRLTSVPAGLPESRLSWFYRLHLAQAGQSIHPAGLRGSTRGRLPLCRRKSCGDHGTRRLRASQHFTGVAEGSARIGSQTAELTTNLSASLEMCLALQVIYISHVARPTRLHLNVRS